jgi:YVTN family beta-propeller protein
MTTPSGPMRALAPALLAGCAMSVAATAPADAKPNPLVPVQLATVPTGIGAGSGGIAINGTNNLVYIANLFASTLSVIDGNSNAVVATIPITDNGPPNPYAAGPAAIAIDQATNTIYVCTNNGTLSVVDGATNQQVANFIVDTTVNSCTGLVFGNQTGKLYFGAGYAGTGSEIDVIDPKTQSITKRIPDPDLNQIAIDQSTNTLYVTQYWEGTLWVIDGDADALRGIISGTGLPAEPEGCWLISPSVPPCEKQHQGSNEDGLAIDETLHRIYVFNSLDGMVATVDTTTDTVIQTRRIGTNQFSGAVNPATHAVYTTSDALGTLAVIDGLSDKVIARNIPVTGPNDLPGLVAVNPVNGKIYVVDFGDVTNFPNVPSHIDILQLP